MKITVGLFRLATQTTAHLGITHDKGVFRVWHDAILTTARAMIVNTAQIPIENISDMRLNYHYLGPK